MATKTASAGREANSIPAGKETPGGAPREGYQPRMDGNGKPIAETRRIGDLARNADRDAGSATSEPSANGGIHWGGASGAGHREGWNDSFTWVKEAVSYQPCQRPLSPAFKKQQKTAIRCQLKAKGKVKSKPSPPPRRPLSPALSPVRREGANLDVACRSSIDTMNDTKSPSRHICKPRPSTHRHSPFLSGRGSGGRSHWRGGEIYTFRWHHSI